MSDASIYKWNAKFDGMDVSEARRLQTLEDENYKLKRITQLHHRDHSADGVFTNVILLGSEPFEPGEGFSLVASDEIEPLPGIGWCFSDSVFI